MQLNTNTKQWRCKKLITFNNFFSYDENFLQMHPLLVLLLVHLLVIMIPKLFQILLRLICKN